MKRNGEKEEKGSKLGGKIKWVERERAEWKEEEESWKFMWNQ